jgi:hypothetical protein
MYDEKKLNTALEKVAQAWCHHTTSDKVLDPELALVFAEILMKEMFVAKLHLASNEELLEEIRSRMY